MHKRQGINNCISALQENAKRQSIKMGSMKYTTHNTQNLQNIKMAVCSVDSKSFIYKEDEEIKSFHPRALRLLQIHSFFLLPDLPAPRRRGPQAYHPSLYFLF